MLLLVLVAFQILSRGLTVEKAAFLHWTPSLQVAVVLLWVEEAVEAIGAADGAREMGNVLGQGMLAADRARVDAVALSGLAHGVVAAVKVLALLQMLRKMIALARKLAVEAEEPLLLRGERLRRAFQSATYTQ